MYKIRIIKDVMAMGWSYSLVLTKPEYTSFRTLLRITLRSFYASVGSARVFNSNGSHVYMTTRFLAVKTHRLNFW
jgi:hypothetical protein